MRYFTDTITREERLAGLREDAERDNKVDKIVTLISGVIFFILIAISVANLIIHGGQ